MLLLAMQANGRPPQHKDGPATTAEEGQNCQQFEISSDYQAVGGVHGYLKDAGQLPRQPAPEVDTTWRAAESVPGYWIENGIRVTDHWTLRRAQTLRQAEVLTFGD